MEVGIDIKFKEAAYLFIAVLLLEACKFTSH